MDDRVIYIDKDDNMLSFSIVYYDGFSATYEVEVRCEGFEGYDSFYLSNRRIEKYLKRLEKMRKALSGDVVIMDEESDSFLKLFFDKYKECYIVGELGGSYNDNFVHFKLKIDPTVLPALENKLKEYVNYNKSRS